MSLICEANLFCKGREETASVFRLFAVDGLLDELPPKPLETVLRLANWFCNFFNRAYSSTSRVTFCPFVAIAPMHSTRYGRQGTFDASALVHSTRYGRQRTFVASDGPDCRGAFQHIAASVSICSAF